MGRATLRSWTSLAEKKFMGSHKMFTLAALVTLTTGVMIARADKPDWVSGLKIFDSQPEPILVILVGGARGVERVRSVIPDERVIAESPGAFATVEERIIAANVDAASAPINQAGWIDREIELVAIRMGGDRRWEQNRNARRRGQGGAKSPEDEVRAAKIAELVQKPTLNAAEAMVLLQHMDQTGQF
jgi:hypothetical protein